jgi:hypothetical protein
VRFWISIFGGVKIVILNRIIVKFKIDFDFVLIGITTSLKDYRVCYLINKHLGFNFAKIADLVVDPLPHTEPASFSFYQFQQKETENLFYFIANKGTEGFLIPEMKEVDYFLMIKNLLQEEETDKYTSLLNRIPEIVAAVKIDPKKIKSRGNLLF